MKNTPNRKELGEAIRRIRVKELKMSIHQFAELTQHSPSTITRVESGDADFGMRGIQAIEGLTQTPFHILLGSQHIQQPKWLKSYYALEHSCRPLVGDVICVMLKKMNQCQKRQVRQ